MPLAQLQVRGLMMAGSVLVLFLGKGGKQKRKLTLPILF